MQQAQTTRFGAALRAARVRAGLTQSELADLAKCTSGYVGHVEQGRRLPSAERVNLLLSDLDLEEGTEISLRIRFALDRIEADATVIRSEDLDTLEAVVEAVVLAASVPATGVSSDSVPQMEVSSLLTAQADLRSKAAVQTARNLTAISRRWTGSTYLTMQEYFEAITAEMGRASLAHVDAVNTIDLRRWYEDVRELGYLATNTAAQERGVAIRRVFIVGSQDADEVVLDCDEAQRDAGIVDVRYLRWDSISDLAEQPEDTVRFRTSSDGDDAGLLFVGHSDPIDVTRVAFGERLLQGPELRRHGQLFELIRTASDPDVHSFIAGRHSHGRGLARTDMKGSKRS